MRSLFLKTLFYFLGALLIFFVIMAVSLFAGFNRSLTNWGKNKSEEIRQAAIRMLDNPDEVPTTTFPENIPVFIYDDTYTLIYTNRGASRRLEAGSEAVADPIMVDGETIGYYHIGNIIFQNDYANQQLIRSMVRVMWIGIVVSWITSVVFALFFSRTLSRPARLVSAGLNRIAAGNLTEVIPERGTDEIAQIALSANNLRSQLLKEKELRAQWAQDIAHDLRTPIAALKAQFEGMADGVLPMNRDRIEQNIAEILRVEMLINDLQELMTLETPELYPNIQEMDIQSLISQLLGAFTFTAQKKNITIAQTVQVPAFRADEALMLRALGNIVNNAIRHSHEGSVITISAEESAGCTVIKIHNTGEVIPEEEIERVFDRLYRGDQARHTPGSGLGLTIARQIIELHGGTIGISSGAEAGTVVLIRLPA